MDSDTQYNYQIALFKIQDELLNFEEFANVGIGNFHSGRATLQFIIELLIAQSEARSSEKFCRITVTQAKNRIEVLITTIENIERKMINLLRIRDDWTEMKNVIESLTTSLHLLNSQISFDEAKTKSDTGKLRDRMIVFDASADNFTTWFESVKETRKPEFLKTTPLAEPQRDGNEETPSTSSSNNSSNVIKEVEKYMDEIKAKFRRRDGRVDMKDIQESNMKIHECWKRYAAELDTEISNKQYIIGEEAKIRTNLLRKITFLRAESQSKRDLLCQIRRMRNIEKPIKELMTFYKLMPLIDQYESMMIRLEEEKIDSWSREFIYPDNMFISDPVLNNIFVSLIQDDIEWEWSTKKKVFVPNCKSKIGTAKTFRNMVTLRKYELHKNIQEQLVYFSQID